MIVHRLSVLLIEFFPQSKIAIPDEPAAAKCPLYLMYLCCGGVDAEFIAVFHFDTSHDVLALKFHSNIILLHPI